jgi:DNA-binding response OmpR family regulator
VALFDKNNFDFVLLDLMLPKMSGLDVCRFIRAKSDVPIIIVSAKGEEVDMVLMLELGADDYVTKPYRLRELVARIRAVMRRRENHEPPVCEEEQIICGRIRMDIDARRCFVDGDEIKLAKEGVRPAAAPAREPRTRHDPRSPDRSDLGQRLRGRHQDPRRAHQAPSHADRERSEEPDVTSPRCAAWATASRSAQTSRDRRLAAQVWRQDVGQGH